MRNTPQWLGCHLSIAKGYAHMAEEAASIGANVMQFFTRNPRGGKARPVDPADMEAFRRLSDEYGFGPLLAHAPYTLNACAEKKAVLEFAAQVMRQDLDFLDQYLPGNLYVFHPGSHVGQGAEKGIGLIADLLNEVLHAGLKTTVLLETMSGKGTEVGAKFEELAAIINKTKQGDRLGVCLDTCHVYSAGYDIVSDIDGVLNRFDSLVGLDKLRAVHLNDSMNAFDSAKDRHAKLGQGALGFAPVLAVTRHEALRDLPFYLETPNEIDGYAAEIKMLRDGKA